MKKNYSISYPTQLFILTLALLIFGLVMIYSASVAEALRDFGDKYHFARLQFKWAGVGLLLFLITSRFNLNLVERFAPTIMIIGLIALVLVLIPGIGSSVQGARRWLILPGFAIQPSELIKLINIIYLSSWLNKKEVTLPQFLTFLIVIAGLILLQPDMGTTIVVTAISIAIYFIAEYPLLHIFSILIAGAFAGLGLILAAPYRMARLSTFLNPSIDPQGSSYHIRQILLALGSGGIFGAGLGKSRQKHQYLPESTTDSIFAVVGEELGFVGAIILILVFAYLIFLIFSIALHSKKPFHRCLAGGVGVWLSLQVILNLSSMVALTPLTGIPLPLISYGGSSLLSMLMAIGIVINIGKQQTI